ncbi:MAG: AmmeMemoRadiSam system radical SAM enzyme [Bacteroidetes bacterium]|nr:MAG: AmmeMemoRadiSam system radical SAM enzyme [Bacteroidota bacterium]
MKFYTKTSKGIKCLLCRHYCNLSEGQAGICGVNKNENGTLKNLVYGKVVALHTDPIEKKPLYHFLPGSSALSIGTVGCNLQCPFCQNWQISQVVEVPYQQKVTSARLIQMALDNHCQSIAYTYNEPTVFYPFARDVAVEAKNHGIKNIFISNGMFSPEIIEDMVGVIDAFNIDLKSFNPGFYKNKLKGNLNGVLDTLKLLRKNKFWLEVTTLVIPDENDSPEELAAIAGFISNELGNDTPWHISAFYPQYKMTYKKRTPAQSLQQAYDIGRRQGLRYVYKGNVAEQGVTRCPVCQKELVVRNGYFIIENVIADGHCPVCNTKISGLWN